MIPEILLATSCYVAVNKPSGLPVIPTRHNKEGPCLRRLLENCLGKKIYVVHRIDAETSGVVLFALTPQAHRDLSIQFERRKVRKLYVARVYGNPEKETWTCTLPVGEGRKGKMRAGGKDSKPAETRFFMVRGLGSGESIILAEPKTGRRHQIRLHLAATGHPVVGDVKYLATARYFHRDFQVPEVSEGPLRLHSWTMSFEDPEVHKQRVIQAPLPDWVPEEVYAFLKRALEEGPGLRL